MKVIFRYLKTGHYFCHLTTELLQPYYHVRSSTNCSSLHTKETLTKTSRPLVGAINQTYKSVDSYAHSANKAKQSRGVASARRAEGGPEGAVQAERAYGWRRSTATDEDDGAIEAILMLPSKTRTQPANQPRRARNQRPYVNISNQNIQIPV